MKRCLVLGLLLAVAVGAVARGSGAENVGDQLLTFLQSAAELIGNGIVQLINLVLPDRWEVGAELVQPVGYLGLITVLLLLFGLLEAARKVIWIVVIVGWALLVVRIVLDILQV